MEKEKSSNELDISDRITSFIPKNSPDVIYHYTSAAGLVGIIQSRSIWATDCLFLNDHKELTHAEDIYQSLHTRWSNESPDEEFSSRISEIMKIVQSWRSASTLTTSFSEEGDVLSQWRAYCPPEGGYSIGFAGDFWKTLGTSFSLALYKCIYDSDDQTKTILNIIDPVGNQKWGVSPSTFELLYRGLRAVLKHPSFREEKEWRIVSLDPTSIISGLKYRTIKNCIVPYYNLKFRGESLPINEIVIGPTLNPEASEYGLRQFLLSAGQTHIQIRRSESTLR